MLPNEMQLCRNLTSGFVILHDPYHLWHHCATSVSDGIFNNSFSGNLTDNLACLGKSGLTLRYLSLVLIESGLQNFCANSVWFLLHSVFCCNFPRKYVVSASIDIQLQWRNLQEISQEHFELFKKIFR